jgi:hypothetical protein
MMNSNDLADYVDHDIFLDDVQKPQPTRATETERDKHRSDVLRLVMEIFPGARWTTREAYRRAAATRDRQGRRRRG